MVIRKPSLHVSTWLKDKKNRLRVVLAAEKESMETNDKDMMYYTTSCVCKKSVGSFMQ